MKLQLKYRLLTGDICRTFWKTAAVVEHVHNFNNVISKQYPISLLF